MYEHLPLNIILLLTLDDPMKHSRISEQRNDELSVEPTFLLAGQDLVDDVVDNAVQEIVPREFEEQVLQAISTKVEEEEW